MATKRVTVKQFAEQQDLNHVTANAVLVFLRAKGVAQIVDKVHKLDENDEPKQGKAANVYELPEEVTIKL